MTQYASYYGPVQNNTPSIHKTCVKSGSDSKPSQHSTGTPESI